jgi:hypothetical protein
MESHAAPSAPPSVHRVPPGAGHAMESHAPAWRHSTSQAHAVPQLIVPPHAPETLHVTSHSALAPQVTSWQAPPTLQVNAQRTPAAHRTLLHAFIAPQVTVQDVAPVGQMRPSHVLEPRQAIVHV